MPTCFCGAQMPRSWVLEFPVVDVDDASKSFHTNGKWLSCYGQTLSEYGKIEDSLYGVIYGIRTRDLGGELHTRRTGVL